MVVIYSVRMLRGKGRGSSYLGALHGVSQDAGGKILAKDVTQDAGGKILPTQSDLAEGLFCKIL